MLLKSSMKYTNVRHTLRSFNMQTIADLLGISRQALIKRCNKLGVDPKRMSLGELVDFINQSRMQRDHASSDVQQSELHDCE